MLTSPSSVRFALAGLSLAMLLSSLGTSIANVGLPAMAQAFDASFQEVQWIVLAYLLAITTLIVSVGRLGDLTGRRRLMLSGIVVFTLASALCGLAPTLWLLIAARAAQGLGAAIMLALAMAFVGDTVPRARTGSAMGLLGTMSAVGTALGPSLGGLLIAGLDWRAIFLVNVPLGVVAFVLAHRHLPADRPRPHAGRGGFDGVGTSLLVVTLAAYALAMTIGRGTFGPLNTALLLAAVCGGALFVLAQTRVASPLIRLAIFRDPALTASLVMSALVSTVMMATLVVGPFYLSRALGLDAAAGRARAVRRPGRRRADRRAGRSYRRPVRRAAPDHRRSGRDRGRFARPRAAAAGAGHRRLPRPDRRHHRRLRAVPDGQQHRCDERGRRRSARRHLRPAQPLAQPRADHRRVGDGCGVRHGVVDE